MCYSLNKDEKHMTNVETKQSTCVKRMLRPLALDSGVHCEEKWVYQEVY